MSVRGIRYTISTNAVVVSAVDTSVTVKNIGSVDADLGGSDVTSGNGFKLAAGEAVGLDLLTGEKLYAISSGAGTTLAVLETRIT